jgi:hypothetical protein
VIFVSDCAPNQGKFYGQFDHVVLLTAPAELIAEHLATRTNNPFGKGPGEIERSLQLKDTVEPLLRMAALPEIDTSQPNEEVVAVVVR